MPKVTEGLFFLGTGVLAEELFALATDAAIPVAGFVENLDPAKAGRLLCDRPILWVDDLPEGARCVCALSTAKRERFVRQVEDRARFAQLIHPSSVILPGTALGEDVTVSSGVLIGGHTTIGNHVFLNRGSRIGHHTRLADYVVLQPGANVAGLVRIGHHTFVGMGAVIIDRVQVGSGAIVAAGAVVTRDVPDRVLVAGVPAVIKKQDVDAR